MNAPTTKLKPYHENASGVRCVQISPKSILVNNIGESAVNLTASIPVGNKTYSLPMFSLMPNEGIELHLGNGTMKIEKPVMNQTGIYFQQKDPMERVADEGGLSINE
ncbi:MAG: hypothetical protein MUO26_02445 [Methanotrichaceae archaeon]|nr:hypothetical protein [Methanotrichaceae archaeon]